MAQNSFFDPSDLKKTYISCENSIGTPYYALLPHIGKNKRSHFAEENFI